MNERTAKVTLTQYEFQCLMNDYSDMAVETGNKRLAAKCAKLCLDQVATSVIRGDDDKDLCYPRDKEYLNIAKRCLF